MPCFKPLQAYRRDTGEIIFNDNGSSHSLLLPCGQCVGCRLEKSRQWAMRCIHEASMYDNNCFITLTYDDFKLPIGHPALTTGSLYKKDFQNFMKRLRKKYVPKNPFCKKTDKDNYDKFHNKHKIRYYQCGEYGDRNNRPHYHAIIFNFNFSDWVYLFDSPSGEPVYTSPELEKIWSLGFVTIGTVSFQSAGYVARYCMKKINGKQADHVDEKTGLKHYERINSYTGEVSEVLPEYSTMSRRGGIGSDWIHKYKSDCYPKDYTTINGVRMRPPKYYDKQLEQIDPYMYDDIKQCRIINSLENAEENTELRLSAKEKVKISQFKQLKRSL